MVSKPRVIIIDDHERVRNSLRALLESANFRVKDYASAVTFLGEVDATSADCLVVDVRMPEMSGFELQQELVRRQIKIPVIVVTGHGDVALAVRAMKAGASDFLEKPFDDEALVAGIGRAIEMRVPNSGEATEAAAAARSIATLTEREREVLKYLALGNSNKQVADLLSISPRTVEAHRAKLQEKMKAGSLSDLVRAVHAVDGNLWDKPSA